MKSEPLFPHVNYTKEHKRQVRIGLIRQVMSIVSAQASVTVAIVQFILTYDKQSLLSQNFLYTIPAFIGYLFIAITLICCKSLARKVPVNYILLFVHTGCISFILAIICEFYTTIRLFNALSNTAVVTVVLKVFISEYKAKITFIVGGIVAACLGILMILFEFFIRFLITGIVPDGLLYFYHLLGVVFYGLFLVFEVKRLTKRKYGLDVDNFVFVALIFHLDIINLFLEILKQVGQKKKNS